MNTQRGFTYVEYLVIALIAALAAIAFFDGGKFLGAKAKIDQGFDGMVSRLVSP